MRAYQLEYKSKKALLCLRRHYACSVVRNKGEGRVLRLWPFRGRRSMGGIFRSRQVATTGGFLDPLIFRPWEGRSYSRPRSRRELHGWKVLDRRANGPLQRSVVTPRRRTWGLWAPMLVGWVRDVVVQWFVVWEVQRTRSRGGARRVVLGTIRKPLHCPGSVANHSSARFLVQWQLRCTYYRFWTSSSRCCLVQVEGQDVIWRTSFLDWRAWIVVWEVCSFEREVLLASWKTRPWCMASFCKAREGRRAAVGLIQTVWRQW